MREAPRKVLLSDLERRDEEAISALGKQLRLYGAALVSAPESSYMESVREGDAVARDFFRMPRDAKLRWEMQPGGERDFGYVEVPGVKEHFQMRVAPGAEDYWPSEEFRAVSERYYHEAMRVTRTVLRCVSRHFGVPEETLAGDLLDGEELGERWSSSIYRYFHYLMLEDARTPPCYVHTDVGLITLVPRSSLPCLQIIHPWSYEWLSVEELAGEGDFVVLAGEMLAYATGQAVRAVVHRVAEGDEPRFSQVFLVRARGDAVLDPTRLPEEERASFAADEGEPMRASKFLAWKYSTRKSANFVKEGQGAPVTNTGPL